MKASQNPVINQLRAGPERGAAVKSSQREREGAAAARDARFPRRS